MTKDNYKRDRYNIAFIINLASAIGEGNIIEQAQNLSSLIGLIPIDTEVLMQQVISAARATYKGDLEKLCTKIATSMMLGL